MDLLDDGLILEIKPTFTLNNLTLIFILKLRFRLLYSDVSAHQNVDATSYSLTLTT